MSQIKAEKLRLNFVYSNIKETISNAAQLLSLNAKMKGIQFEIEYSEDLPQTFCTDHMRLSQIVLNLINNSIKFTQEGHVSLSVQPVEGVNWIKIVVRDSGIGITEDDIKKLFNVFTHIEVHNRVNMNPSGAGLGLSIAHNLAKLLGPENNNGIKVTSAPGQGSTFSFIIDNKERREIEVPVFDTAVTKEEIPLVNETQEDQEISEEPLVFHKIQSCITLNSLKILKGTGTETEKDICKCPKILVVDDDAFNVLAYKSILNSFHVKCDCAYSGKAGIEKLTHRASTPCSAECKPFSLVFMDQEMPGMNGTETVKEIRNLEKLSFLPKMAIIGCTAHKDGGEIQRFLQAGLDKCIEKPISINTIKGLLDQYEILEQ